MSSKIQFVKYGDSVHEDYRYEVDPIDQSGTPVVGRGKTLSLALVDFLHTTQNFK